MKNQSSLNKTVSAIALLGTAALFTLSASADPIAIVNPGFEPDATFTLTNPTGGYVGSSGLGSNQSFGGSGYTGPAEANIPGFTGSAYIQLLGTNYENAGSSSGFVATLEASDLSQTLNATLLPNATYTLTFDASSRPDQGRYTQGGFTADLDAGGIALTPSNNGGSDSPTLSSTLVPITLTYETGAVVPSGETLAISFANSESGSAQVLLDNLSLNVTQLSAPEPSSVALLLTGVIAMTFAGRYRARRS